ncbi:hypothetical protein QJQ45_018294 [Haematococcus lacustris]|nr:hypothetical protein QJQ45_018294 [Haematococcus lacustris]
MEGEAAGLSSMRWQAVPGKGSGGPPRLVLGPGAAFAVPGVEGSSLDLELCLCLVQEGQGGGRAAAPTGRAKAPAAAAAASGVAAAAAASGVAASGVAGVGPEQTLGVGGEADPQQGVTAAEGPVGSSMQVSQQQAVAQHLESLLVLGAGEGSEVQAEGGQQQGGLEAVGELIPGSPSPSVHVQSVSEALQALQLQGRPEQQQQQQQQGQQQGQQSQEQGQAEQQQGQQQGPEPLDEPPRLQATGSEVGCRIGSEQVGPGQTAAGPTGEVSEAGLPGAADADTAALTASGAELEPGVGGVPLGLLPGREARASEQGGQAASLPDSPQGPGGAEAEAEDPTGGMGRTEGDHPDAVAPAPQGACSGLLLRAWQAGQEGSAALLYCWDTQILEVVFEALDPETHEFSLAAPGCRRVGGKLMRPPLPGQPMHLRVLLDASLLEVFTGGGEVLTTRVYRGVGPPGSGAGIELVSVGCSTEVLRLAAYEMDNCLTIHDPNP